MLTDPHRILLNSPWCERETGPCGGSAAPGKPSTLRSRVRGRPAPGRDPHRPIRIVSLGSWKLRVVNGTWRAHPLMIPLNTEWCAHETGPVSRPFGSRLFEGIPPPISEFKSTRCGRRFDQVLLSHQSPFPRDTGRRTRTRRPVAIETSDRIHRDESSVARRAIERRASALVNLCMVPLRSSSCRTCAAIVRRTCAAIVRRTRAAIPRRTRAAIPRRSAIRRNSKHAIQARGATTVLVDPPLNGDRADAAELAQRAVD